MVEEEVSDTPDQVVVVVLSESVSAGEQSCAACIIKFQEFLDSSSHQSVLCKCTLFNASSQGK